MEKQLTAVEWLYDQLDDDFLWSEMGINMLTAALAMEKEQLKDAYDAGIWDVGCKAPNFDEYYKRTFKSE